MAKKPEKASKNLLRRRMKTAVKERAKSGAKRGAILSGASNLVACVKGEKALKDAVIDTTKETAASAVTEAVSSGAEVVTENLLVRVTSRAVIRRSAPMIAGMTVVETGKDLFHLLDGKIDGKAFVTKAGKNVVRSATTVGGMEAGAAIGTAICPGVGTLVGSLIGGIVGGGLGKKIVG